MSRTRRRLLWLMAAFDVVAGSNHRVNPGSYVAILPANRYVGLENVGAPGRQRGIETSGTASYRWLPEGNCM